MPEYREIRADFDRTTIVVYQAFNDAIADAALAAQRLGDQEQPRADPGGADQPRRLGRGAGRCRLDRV